MRHSRARVAFFALTATAVVVGVACGDDDGGGTDVNDPAETGPAPVRADAKTSGPDGEAPSPLSTMRLAHLAAEIGPIDFCYQEAHAGTFVGPVLGGPKLAKPDARDAGDAGDADDAGDGGDSGDASDVDASDEDADADAAMPQLASLAFGSVTKYLVLQSSGPMTMTERPE